MSGERLPKIALFGSEAVLGRLPAWSNRSITISIFWPGGLASTKVNSSFKGQLSHPSNAVFPSWQWTPPWTVSPTMTLNLWPCGSSGRWGLWCHWTWAITFSFLMQFASAHSWLARAPVNFSSAVIYRLRCSGIFWRRIYFERRPDQEGHWVWLRTRIGSKVVVSDLTHIDRVWTFYEVFSSVFIVWTLNK